MRNIKQLFDLSGRVAIVTGGSGHIGMATSHALAELGASVVIADVQNSASAAEAIRQAYGGETLGVEVNLSHEDQVRNLPLQVMDKFGRLDIVINNAAWVARGDISGWVVPFAEQSAQTWRDAMEVNLTSTFVLCQAAAPFLKKSPSGSIINVISLYGFLGPDWGLYEGTEMGNSAGYSVSKGGLLQFTRWLSTTLALSIRVNAISPGGVLRGQHQAFQERFVKKTPLGRMSIEEDLKGAMAFLASDASSYMTGQNLVVDGGFSVW